MISSFQMTYTKYDGIKLISNRVRRQKFFRGGQQKKTEN